MKRQWEVFTRRGGGGRRGPRRDALTDGAVIRLRDSGGLTFRAIAERLGVSRQAVNERYRRAKHLIDSSSRP